jgi:hypothetical protein
LFVVAITGKRDSLSALVLVTKFCTIEKHRVLAPSNRF